MINWIYENMTQPEKAFKPLPDKYKTEISTSPDTLSQTAEVPQSDHQT